MEQIQISEADIIETRIRQITELPRNNISLEQLINDIHKVYKEALALRSLIRLYLDLL